MSVNNLFITIQFPRKTNYYYKRIILENMLYIKNNKVDLLDFLISTITQVCKSLLSLT